MAPDAAAPKVHDQPQTGHNVPRTAPRTMRALVQPRYGGVDVLQLRDVDKPTPGPDDVLVRVHAVSLNFGDKATLEGKPYVFRAAFGLLRPRTPIAGRDVAGVVEAVGAEIRAFKPGDEVYGELTRGSLAEYALAHEGELALKPNGISFEEAATVPIAGVTALQGLRDCAGVKPGHKVLINGASGGVGTFAVQIAKALGAEVTAVCSAANAEQARSIGADEVIDYRAEDFTTLGRRFDVVFDLAASQPLARTRSVLVPGGVYVASSGRGGGEWLGPLARIAWVAMNQLVSPKAVRVFAASTGPDGLRDMNALLEARQVRPIIERTYELDEAPEAFRRLLSGHAQAKLVIRV